MELQNQDWTSHWQLLQKLRPVVELHMESGGDEWLQVTAQFLLEESPKMILHKQLISTIQVLTVIPAVSELSTATSRAAHRESSQDFSKVIILGPAVRFSVQQPSQQDLRSKMLFQWLHEMTAAVSPAKLSFILRSLQTNHS